MRLRTPMACQVGVRRGFLKSRCWVFLVRNLILCAVSVEQHPVLVLGRNPLAVPGSDVGWKCYLSLTPEKQCTAHLFVSSVCEE